MPPTPSLAAGSSQSAALPPAFHLLSLGCMQLAVPSLLACPSPPCLTSPPPRPTPPPPPLQAPPDQLVAAAGALLSLRPTCSEALLDVARCVALRGAKPALPLHTCVHVACLLAKVGAGCMRAHAHACTHVRTHTCSVCSFLRVHAGQAAALALLLFLERPPLFYLYLCLAVRCS